jgi:hypothetical protein
MEEKLEKEEELVVVTTFPLQECQAIHENSHLSLYHIGALFA